jgi:predicted nucleic acid-binding Zn ribbon protein
MTGPGDATETARLPAHPPPPPQRHCAACGAPVPMQAVICPACGVILAVEATDARIRKGTARLHARMRDAVMRFLRRRFAVLWLMALLPFAFAPAIAALGYCSWRVLRPAPDEAAGTLAQYAVIGAVALANLFFSYHFGQEALFLLAGWAGALSGAVESFLRDLLPATPFQPGEPPGRIRPA